MLADDEGKKAGGIRMPDAGRIGRWAYIGVIIALSIYLILYNPGNLFGESEPFGEGVFAFQTYKGQLTALQFTGTFIVVLGLLTTMSIRRFPDVTKATGLAGASVVMLSQVIQIIQENTLLLVILPLLAIYIGLFWLIKWGWNGLKWVYSRIKPRRNSQG